MFYIFFYFMNVKKNKWGMHLYDAQIKILAIRELFMQFALTEHPLEKLETWILALQVLSFQPSGESPNILLDAHGNIIVGNKAGFRAAAF